LACTDAFDQLAAEIQYHQFSNPRPGDLKGCAPFTGMLQGGWPPCRNWRGKLQGRASDGGGSIPSTATKKRKNKTQAGGFTKRRPRTPHPWESRTVVENGLKRRWKSDSTGEDTDKDRNTGISAIRPC
jgi:hypothetical protein